jgi:glycerol uptake facilitator-like aquaporin
MRGYTDLESGASRQIGAMTNEVIGTFFISLALFAGTSGWSALAAAGMLAFFTWFSGDGHYNAAVTLSKAVGKDKDIGINAAVKCILAQIVGAVLAVLFAGFVAGGAPSAPSSGGLTSGVADLLLTLVLIYSMDFDGRNRGLGYFAGLSAFPSALGANASVVLGVVLGNAALGNGLTLGAGTLWGAGAPLVAGALFPFLGDVFGKIPRSNELLGTFFFGTMAFSIGFGNAFAVGAALHTVSQIFPGTYNPAATLYGFAKAGFPMATVADPIIDIVVQSVGAALAAIVTTFLGTAAGVPAAVDIGPACVLELLFTIVFVNVATDADTLNRGVGYFAATTAFASSFNTAFGLGLYLAGLAGFGSGSLAMTSLVNPLVGGLLGGFLAGKFSEFNQLVGTLFLFLFAGSTSNILALGAALATLTTAYGGNLNPALNFADVKTSGFQVGGAVVGSLLANWAGLSGGSVSAGGLSDGGKSIAAEILLGAFLAQTYASKGDNVTTGLSYYALLAALGATAGSLANPALVLGNWVGGGILGGGFDFGVDALIGLVGHVAAPALGAFLSDHIFNLHSKLMLDKAQLDSSEFFGSFLLVALAAGVAGAGDDAPTALAYGLVIATVYKWLGSANDFFPAVSAYRAFGSNADVVGFLKKLVAQTLGALVAAAFAAWLFAAAGGHEAAAAVHAPAPEPVAAPAAAAAAAPAAAAARRALQAILSDPLRNGILAGMFWAWSYNFKASGINQALTYFTAVTIFAGVNINGAASLGAALYGAATGGGFGFATDTDFWFAFLAPVVGAVLAGRLEGPLGK